MAFGPDTEQIRAQQDLASCTDEELVRLLVSGDHDAMSVIFDRHYATIMRVALRIVRDRGEAEDVVQITFTDFYRNAKIFDPYKGSLRTWLLQYTYGRSINRLKGLKSRRHFCHAELSDVDASDLAVNGKDAFRLSSQEAKLFVAEVLESLTEKHRRVIELICFCGLTIAEVASVTGDSVGNVQHHYYRSIERLRVLFRDGRARKAADRPTVRKEPSAWVLRRMSKPAKALRGEVESVKTQIL